MNVRKTAGSDAHFPENIGKAYVIVKDNVDSEDGVLEAIRKGRVKTGGSNSTGSQTMRYGYKAIIQWARRGFKKM